MYRHFPLWHRALFDAYLEREGWKIWRGEKEGVSHLVKYKNECERRLSSYFVCSSDPRLGEFCRPNNSRDICRLGESANRESNCRGQSKRFSIKRRTKWCARTRRNKQRPLVTSHIRIVLSRAPETRYGPDRLEIYADLQFISRREKVQLPQCLHSLRIRRSVLRRSQVPKQYIRWHCHDLVILLCILHWVTTRFVSSKRTLRSLIDLDRTIELTWSTEQLAINVPSW